MKDLFCKRMSLALKILCAIVIIATAGTVEASAASAPKKRKAKTTKVKKVKKLRKSRKSQEVTELRIVEDERLIGCVADVDSDIGLCDIIKKEVIEVVKEEPKVEPKITEEAYNVEPKKEEPKIKKEEEQIYSSAHRMPSFPGGDAALMKYLSKNIRYPQIAKDNGIQGKVVIQMVIMKDGKVGEVKVVRGVDKDLDREAVRVCKSLPPFSPGRNANGDPINVWYTLPVTFKLQGSN